MTNKRSYLIKAIYAWINDNSYTPHILVDTKFPDVYVPQEYIHQDQIAFNISEQAIRNLSIDLDYIAFQASFNGVAQEIKFPIYAVKAIYAEEQINEGMSFSINYEDAKFLNKETKSSSQLHKKNRTINGKPHLKIVK